MSLMILRAPIVVVCLAAVTAGSTPAVSSVTPLAPVANLRPQTLTINGKDFLPKLTLDVTSPGGGTKTLQGEAIKDRTEGMFRVSLVLDVAGVYSLKVINTDGGCRRRMPWKCAVASEPAAAIDRVVPEVPGQDPQPQVLRLEGRNFTQGLSAMVTIGWHESADARH